MPEPPPSPSMPDWRDNQESAGSLQQVSSARELVSRSVDDLDRSDAATTHTQHLRSYVSAIWKDSVALMSGGIGVLLAFLAAYFAFIASHNIAVLWLAALVACTFTSYRVWRRQQITLGEKIAALEERLRSKLTIVYRPRQIPYEQEYDGGITQYRVSVVSPDSVTDTELVANKARIGSREESGLHLRERHDRYQAKRVAIKPFKEGVWDVIHTKHTESGDIAVFLNHITDVEQVVFPVGVYEFELMASGGRNPPATKIVHLEVRADNTVTFEVRDGRLSEILL